MHRIAFIALLALPGSALAQTVTDPIDPSIFVGERLLSNDEKYELTKAPRFQFQPTEMLVLGLVKPEGAWTDADTAACTGSGGEVIPLPAARKTCFKF